MSHRMSCAHVSQLLTASSASFELVLSVFFTRVTSKWAYPCSSTFRPANKRRGSRATWDAPSNNRKTEQDSCSRLTLVFQTIRTASLIDLPRGTFRLLSIDLFIRCGWRTAPNCKIRPGMADVIDADDAHATTSLMSDQNRKQIPHFKQKEGTLH